MSLSSNLLLPCVNDLTDTSCGRSVMVELEDSVTAIEGL